MRVLYILKTAEQALDLLRRLPVGGGEFVVSPGCAVPSVQVDRIVVVGDALSARWSDDRARLLRWYEESVRVRLAPDGLEIRG